MLKYKIKISYETGDSGGLYDEVGHIEHEWKNLEIAKENLKRIKEHYLWYDEKECLRRKRSDEGIHEEPEWHKGLYPYQIMIKTDDEKEVEYHAYWVGYFESLQRAEIIFDKSGMVIEF